MNTFFLVLRGKCPISFFLLTLSHFFAATWQDSDKGMHEAGGGKSGRGLQEDGAVQPHEPAPECRHPAPVLAA